jgi:hypothetical protein
MATTITDGVTVVNLPDDLLWRDEFTTSQIAQDTKRTLTGAFVIFEDTKVKGRSMSLESDDDSGWIERADLLALRALFEQEDTDLDLFYRGVIVTVRVNRANGSGVSASPVMDCSNPSTEALYALSMALITV